MADLDDLTVYRVAVELAREVERAIRGPMFRGGGELARQLRKSAVSVVSNIAEGHGRGRRKEFAHYLLIAKGSCSEAKSQVAMARDADRLTLEQYRRLDQLADRVGAMLYKLHISVEKQEDPGA